jgi:hypothetical protein
MDWLEQNLDAYRIIAEILEDLRGTLRKRLEQIHGSEWYKVGLPDGLLPQLVERKEQEKAIDWYESEYQQVMSYALFPDLLAVLEHNPQALPQILRLAPTPSLLQARFLELEVMRAKLGRARPISETELSFLGTFHLRFRKAIEEHRSQAAAGVSTPAKPAAPVVTPVALPSRPNPAEVAPETAAGAAPPHERPEETSSPRPGRETHRSASTPVPPPAPPSTPSPTARAATAGGPQPGAQLEPEVIEVTEVAEEDLGLEAALEGGHHQMVLRELYREVTSIAEGIWTKDIPPAAKVWEKVSVSRWYEESFSALGLRPLSDFYDIIAKVDQRMRAGVSRDELQRFLKEVNFAQTLLALRDMFQRNAI